MRWKTKEVIEERPISYERRFAFLPTKLNDGYTVWLCHYWAKIHWFKPYPNAYPNDWRQDNIRYYYNLESAQMDEEA